MGDVVALGLEQPADHRQRRSIGTPRIRLVHAGPAATRCAVSSPSDTAAPSHTSPSRARRHHVHRDALRREPAGERRSPIGAGTDVRNSWSRRSTRIG